MIDVLAQNDTGECIFLFYIICVDLPALFITSLQNNLAF